jgi:hypothetical protein
MLSLEAQVTSFFIVHHWQPTVRISTVTSLVIFQDIRIIFSTELIREEIVGAAQQAFRQRKGEVSKGK